MEPGPNSASEREGGAPVRVALVTGASSGLGKRVAERFLAGGWSVAATMRAPSFGSPSSDRMLSEVLDVTKPESISSAVEAVLSRFGRIDAVVNNAGFGLAGVFEAISPEDVQRQFDVNLFGVMNVCREVLPIMRRQRSGVIANISSAAGVFAMPGTSVYTASKFALEGFSEALAHELRSQNIAVKIIEPGGIGGTNFSANSLKANPPVEVPADYAAFAGRTFEMFAAMSRAPMTDAALVADVVFDAVNDGSEQLRYVATEDVRPLISMRRGSSEEQFMAHMRRLFSSL